MATLTLAPSRWPASCLRSSVGSLSFRSKGNTTASSLSFNECDVGVRGHASVPQAQGTKSTKNVLVTNKRACCLFFQEPKLRRATLMKVYAYCYNGRELIYPVPLSSIPLAHRIHADVLQIFSTQTGAENTMLLIAKEKVGESPGVRAIDITPKSGSKPTLISPRSQSQSICQPSRAAVGTARVGWVPRYRATQLGEQRRIHVADSHAATILGRSLRAIGPGRELCSTASTLAMQ